MFACFPHKKDLKNTNEQHQEMHDEDIPERKKIWIGVQCGETEKNLWKNNSKRTYQLVKDLTTVKQGKVITVQDRSGKCFTEEREILNRWKEYYTELYNHKANGDPLVLDCHQTDTEDDHPILRKEA